MNTGSLDPLFGGVDGGGVLLPEGNHLPLHLFDLQHVELEEGEGDGSSVADSEDWTKVALWFSGCCLSHHSPEYTSGSVQVQGILVPKLLSPETRF